VDSPDVGAHDDPVDVRAVMAEIERDARARRRVGAVPIDYEHELDALFESIAPVGARFDSVEAVLGQSERIAGFNVAAPTESRLPGGAFVKRGVQRAVGWQFHFFASQVQALSYSVLRALRLLTERVVELERRLPVTDSRGRELHGAKGEFDDLSAWHSRVAEWCEGSAERVLHGESGTGALVVALNEKGIDAYGVDPHDDAGSLADAAGVETRTIGVLEHLGALPEASLGALVLTACVDLFALGDQLELATQAVRVLAPGGRLVVIGTHPRAWALRGDPVQTDLTFGRPLHPETWMHILGEAGFSSIERHDGEQDHVPSPADGAVTPEVAEALRELQRVVFPPRTFAVVATRAAPVRSADSA
jgi:SAM-dependent methyltransferase